MTRKLTGKQERFIDEYCSNGFNGTRAVVSAGYNVKNDETAAAIAYENLRKPQIENAIVTRKAELAQRCEITRERQIWKYEKNIQLASEAGQFAAANQAIKGQCELAGLIGAGRPTNPCPIPPAFVILSRQEPERRRIEATVVDDEGER